MDTERGREENLFLKEVSSLILKVKMESASQLDS